MISGHVCMYAHSLSHAQLFVTPWLTAHQVSLSMEFSKQEYWSGLPFPTPGNLPNPGIKPTYSASPVLTGRFLTTAPAGQPSMLLNTLNLAKIKVPLKCDYIVSGCFPVPQLACAHAQSHPTVCEPMDYSPPGSSVHGILQARILEWVAVSFSKGYASK